MSTKPGMIVERNKKKWDKNKGKQIERKNLND